MYRSVQRASDFFKSSFLFRFYTIFYQFFNKLKSNKVVFDNIFVNASRFLVIYHKMLMGHTFAPNDMWSEPLFYDFKIFSWFAIIDVAQVELHRMQYVQVAISLEMRRHEYSFNIKSQLFFFICYLGWKQLRKNHKILIFQKQFFFKSIL